MGVYRAELPFARMESKHIREIRDEKRERPEAANGRVKALRSLFSWAKEVDHVKANPTLDILRLKIASEGFHTWPSEEIAQFEARHPVSTKARLDLRLATIHRRSPLGRCEARSRNGAGRSITFYDNEGRTKEGQARTARALPEAPSAADPARTANGAGCNANHSHDLSGQ